jgi:2',5'-phosphodiesterase
MSLYYDELLSSFALKSNLCRYTKAMSKISTVAQLAVLEPVATDSELDASATPALVVANTHLFFHPGAVHLRVLQARWLLRHADGLRRRYQQEVSQASGLDTGSDDREVLQRARAGVGLVICGDFNGEPCDGVIRFMREGRLGAGDPAGGSLHSTDIDSPSPPPLHVCMSNWTFAFIQSHVPISVECWFSMTLLPGLGAG